MRYSAFRKDGCKLYSGSMQEAGHSLIIQLNFLWRIGYIACATKTEPVLLQNATLRRQAKSGVDCALVGIRHGLVRMA